MLVHWALFCEYQKSCVTVMNAIVDLYLPFVQIHGRDVFSVLSYRALEAQFQLPNGAINYLDFLMHCVLI